MVESFPVGRRLAFDQRRGRLWVVCRKCEKWNLTPLEERWEAIEKCEQLFHDTKKRISTDNIGLAQLNEGLELVRIGEPQRPEFAAWRYGDQFGRRHRRAMVVGAATTSLSVGVNAMVFNPGFAGGALTMAGMLAMNAVSWSQIIAQTRRRRRLLARIHVPTGDKFRLKPWERFRVVRDSGAEGWALDVHHTAGAQLITGDAALRAMTHIMAHMNHEGGSKKKITSAVNRIESIGDSHRLFRWVAQQPDRQKPQWWRKVSRPRSPQPAWRDSIGDGDVSQRGERTQSRSKASSPISRRRGKTPKKSPPSLTASHCRVPLSMAYLICRANVQKAFNQSSKSH